MTIYETDALLYDQIYGGDDAKALEFVKWLMDFLELNKTSNILDMGAGTGNILIPLTQNGFSIAGMEPYDVMLDHALKKAKSQKINISISNGSFESLDELNEYDLVMAINGPFHYVKPENLDKVLFNLSNSLKQGGYLVLDTINFFSLIKNYSYPEPMDFEIDGNPATAMIQHWVDLDNEKWYNRVVLMYKDQEYQKIEDIQKMYMYTKTQLKLEAEKHGLDFYHFFSSYEDRPNERVYGGRLITVFKKK